MDRVPLVSPGTRQWLFLYSDLFYCKFDRPRSQELACGEVPHCSMAESSFCTSHLF